MKTCISKLTTLCLGAIAVAGSSFNASAQPIITVESEEFGPPSFPLINDYVSLGEFETDGDLEGWVPQNLDGTTTCGGNLTGITPGNDPHFHRAGLTIDPNFTILQMRVRSRTGGPGNAWENFWGQDLPGETGFAGSRRTTFTVPVSEQWHIVNFDYSALPAALTAFRVDPEGVGTWFEVDYVRVGRVAADSDGDGLADDVETGTQTFVSRQDTGTDPAKPDSDGDTWSDGAEVDAGTDPNNINDFPVPTIVRYPGCSEVREYAVNSFIPWPGDLPTVINGTPTSFSISPTLPEGMTFDELTGAIGGFPTVVTPEAVYTVTANFEGGATGTLDLTISVVGAVFTYPPPAERILIAGQDIVIEPNFGDAGVFPTNVYSQPDLPAGLAIGKDIADMGSIMGAPTNWMPVLTDYTIIAEYADGPDITNVLTFAVLEDPTVTVSPEDELLSTYSLGEYDGDSADLDRIAVQHAVSLEMADVVEPDGPTSGVLRVTSTEGDPYFGWGLGNLNPAGFKIVEFRRRMPASDGGANTVIYYWEDGRSGFRTFSLPTEGTDPEQFEVVRVDFTRSLMGNFTTFRFDPGNTAGTVTEWDYIHLGGFLPTLNVAAQEDGSVRLSWPAAAQGFTVESRTDPNADWADSGRTPAVEGGENVVTIPRAEQIQPGEIFRLSKP